MACPVDEGDTVLDTLRVPDEEYVREKLVEIIPVAVNAEGDSVVEELARLEMESPVMVAL